MQMATPEKRPKWRHGFNADDTFNSLRGRLAGTSDPEKKAKARAEFEAYKRKRHIELLQEALDELVAAGGEAS
jgi:hypothetical protein